MRPHIPPSPQDEITQWLDDEWIERDIHRAIGERAGAAYAAARDKGVNEVGYILMEVRRPAASKRANAFRPAVCRTYGRGGAEAVCGFGILRSA